MGKIVLADQPCLDKRVCKSFDGVQVYEGDEGLCFACHARWPNYSAQLAGGTASLDATWDSSRGPRMSDTVGLQVLKYQMPVMEEFTLDLPAGAEVLRVDDQDGMLWLWALVDTHQPVAPRTFVALKTGGRPPKVMSMGGYVYLGFVRIFVQMELGLYIFEVR